MIQGKETSPKTDDYNCIAWATEDDSNFWWPRGFPPYFWPEGIELEETLGAFIKAFETCGFKVCDNELFEQGFEKIAIYIDEYATPKHAARQIDKDTWTSKLGSDIDIVHPFISKWSEIWVGGKKYDLSFYGKLAQIMKRKNN